MRRATQRPCVVVRSASAPAQTTAAPAEAKPSNSPVVSLSSDEYDEFLASNELVLVDYYTDWCGPCKMIAPHLEEMATEMPNVKFAKLNCTTDANAKKIAMSAGIKALPTFHLFRNNEKVGTFVGGKPTALRKFLNEQVA
jgi:thioredoxin 1